MNKRDPINKNVESDMFFQTKRVLTFDDQMDKYLILLIWGNIWPFNYIIPVAFLINVLMFVWGLFMNMTLNTREHWGIYPDMYTNLLAWLLLHKVDPLNYFLPQKYYDIFTWVGFWDFLIESQLLFWLPAWELFLFLGRMLSNDWEWA